MMEYKGYRINGDLKKIYWLRQTRYINKQKVTVSISKQYICLDTETSHNHNEEHPECWVYQWAFTFNNAIYYGRKPSDLIKAFNKIIEFYHLDENNKIYVFVHNLPYDFSYLCLFLHQAYGDPVNILASDLHKPFVITYSCGLEFRCTYKLSNDSLDRWSRKLGVKHPKMVGAIDYDVIRYQDSPLFRDDWRYMFTDCIAMDESLKKQLDLYDDSIKTLPLTSTGYPRREVFRAYNGHDDHKKKNKERQKFKDTRLDTASFLAYDDDYAGGITHGNRYYRNKTLKGDIRHRDFRSHYPTQQQKLMPMGKPVPFTGQTTLAALEKYMDTFAILCHVRLKDVKIRSKKITLPYLQSSHVQRHHTKGFRLLDDNGRVIQFQGTSELWLDINELKIILDQYTCDYMITESYASMWGPLPPWMTDTVNRHFKLKSDLSKKVKDAKNAGADRDEILKLELDLMKSKNMLNGIYGVTGTNPVREEITLASDVWDRKKPELKTIGEKLDKYYNSYKHCMRYPWGVYTTILARLQLMEVYNIIGADNFIYADTDSMFYFSTPEIEQKLNDYNEQLKHWAMQNKAYIITDTGDIINYNAFLDEGENIKEFRFLHSKCYAYVTDDNKLHCTIAGVKAYDHVTKTYREDELGSIDDLDDGKVFTKCGGTKAKYIATGDIEITAYGQEWAGGCIISRTTKTLSATEWAEEERAYLIKPIN